MRKSLILFLFVVVVSVATTLRPTRVAVVGWLPESAELSLKSEGIACQQDGTLTVLEFWDREAAVRALARSYVALTRKKDVVENNIANYQTTMTSDGWPYRCLYQTLNDDGSAGEILEEGGFFNWVYDPKSPDAMQDGCYQGYVPKPCVNLAHERYAWIRIDSDQRMVREILLQLDPTVVFCFTDSERDPASLARVEKFCEEQRGIEQSKAELFQHGLKSTVRTLQERNAKSVSMIPKRRELPAKPWTSIFDKRWCIAQNSDIGSGLASVATALNWLSAKKTHTCEEIEKKYGFDLLNALKSESAGLGFDWRDRGSLSKDNWSEIELALAHHVPVIVALGDSSDERGRVIMLAKVWEDDVTYADPVSGELSHTTRQELLDAPSHPDGNFVFIPTWPGQDEEDHGGETCLSL